MNSLAIFNSFFALVAISFMFKSDFIKFYRHQTTVGIYGPTRGRTGYWGDSRNKQYALTANIGAAENYGPTGG